MQTARYETSTRHVDWEGLRDTLTADHFHNGRTWVQYRDSFEASHAVVFAYVSDALVGTGRLLSDGVCNAYVVDVWTHSSQRRQGIGTSVVQRLLARAEGQHVCLFTTDMQDFYARLGFQPQAVGMSLVRGRWLSN